jgi:preprotein translocase subunit SecD
MRQGQDSLSRTSGATRGFIFAVSVVATLAFVGLNGCSPGPPTHGTSFLVTLSTNQARNLADHSNQLTRASKMLGKRLHKFGVNYSIKRVIPDRLLIRIQVNGNGVDAASDLISRHGLLEFRMVHPESAALIKQGIIEPGYEVLKEEVTSRDGRTTFEPWLVKKAPERGLTGEYIHRVSVMRDKVTGKPEIYFELDATGAKLLKEITTEFKPAGKQVFELGIVLDGELVSVPRITGVLPSGRGVIQGNFTIQKALAFAGILENPLESSLRILEVRSF